MKYLFYLTLAIILIGFGVLVILFGNNWFDLIGLLMIIGFISFTAYDFWRAEKQYERWISNFTPRLSG